MSGKMKQEGTISFFITYNRPTIAANTCVPWLYKFLISYNCITNAAITGIFWFYIFVITQNCKLMLLIH